MLEHTQRMQVLQLRIKKIQHDQDGMHDMAIMMRCNLSSLSGIGTRTNKLLGSSCISTGKVKWLLAWQDMAGVSYFNIKRSGENHNRRPKYSAYMLGAMHELSRLDMMQDANRHIDGIFMFSTFF
jgi:hypothetical protein